MKKKKKEEGKEGMGAGVCVGGGDVFYFSTRTNASESIRIADASRSRDSGRHR